MKRERGMREPTSGGRRRGSGVAGGGKKECVEPITVI